MPNYFTLLGIQSAFALDLAALESAYFREQQKSHPDRFVGKPPAERQQALQRSVDINQAYETLKNPLKRAQYLLSLNGIKVGTDNDSVKPSQALLMEVMELRESPDAQKLATLKEESITRVASLAAAKDWQNMAQETLRLGYLLKALDEVK